MQKQKISMIAAVGKNRELGKDNKLLWHIREDLKRFKKLTTGHVVIMGRKTYESIGRPLPNRYNIAITRDTLFHPTGVSIVHSIKEALQLAESKQAQKSFPGEIFIIGGGQIYNQGITFADRLYLTVVEASYDADTFFPEYSRFHKIISEEKGESEGLKYKYMILEK